MKTFARCVLVLGALALVPSAAAAKTVNSTLKGKLAIIDTTGGTITSAGAGKDSKLGDVAVVLKTKATGSTLKGTGVTYFKTGTLKGTITLTIKTNADGSTTYTGIEKTTGGTGAYAGAKGTATVTATQPKAVNGATQPVTFKTVGKFTY